MRRRKTAIFFLVLGICLSALAIALNVGWILLSFREVLLLVLGMIFFGLIITGLILNTIFLVREIRRNEQHDAFINAVSHELKTPVASIKLYLDTLSSREISPEQAAEFYAIMRADADRLMNTVEQVLEASRMKEKTLIDRYAECDLKDIISGSIQIIANRYNLEPGMFRLTVPDGALTVFADRNSLETAFVNLLDNSVKYSADEPRISIRVKKTGLNGNIIVMLKDSGIGIPPSDLKKIFKRFYRTPGTAASAAKGTGLGLYIVRSIIEKHGGKITADSKGIGKGSTFVIQLPLA
jgi:two-component system, OmpR family, sensor histidine kinase SenX3